MKKWEKVSGKNVILGVCSSIAVYKACQLVSTLTKNGADVHVVMTESARKLISERIFQTLTRNPVCADMWAAIPDWKPEHISLAQSADIMVVAPATANAIGHFANGIADDFLSTVYLACKAPVLIAPAMNCNMYRHPAVARNIGVLSCDGVEFVGPDDGSLACGDSGKGRMAEVEEIMEAICNILE